MNIKKYYFNSIGGFIGYLFMDIFFIFIIVGMIIFKNPDASQGMFIFVLCFFILTLLIVGTWTFFSVGMRIEINFDNQTLYIRHFKLVKKFKFADVENIKIERTSNCTLYFTIFSFKKYPLILYSRYLKLKSKHKYILIINELEQDLKLCIKK